MRCDRAIPPLPIVSSSMSGRPGYEVFLCFRGPDTRNHFADFLHYMLTAAGIHVFRDEEELERGRELDPQLIEAIGQSTISLPVISMEFASSRSCLMESVRMVDCMDRKNHTIIPIFYLVNPSDVRHCSGSFKTVLDKDQKGALQRIGNLKGYHHVQRSEAYHTEVLKKIVRDVELKLKKRDLRMPKHLVPVDPHVQEIMAKLKVDYRNGQIGDSLEKVLIYGIPGVGKTVLAKCVYNKLHHLYDACSFLEKIQEEIRDHGILSVQNKLISHLHKRNAQEFDCPDHALKHFEGRFHAMKVLVLLDDVKDRKQLHDLVGELDWLGPGSTVIVTSQRNDVLKNLKGTESFCLGTMQQDKALQLFCWHAFEKDSPPEEFEERSANIAAATDGLPLALKNAGESLFREEESIVWTETLTALKQAPEKGVREAFSKSYNTLGQHEWDIFLDIACFCNGKDMRIPYYMWDACGFFPSISILSLRTWSLVEIGEDEELCMRGILKTFGLEIVKNESRKEPWLPSRICNHKEALDVLRRGKGTARVEALGLEFADGSVRNISFQCDRFNGFDNLRFLKLDQADIRGNFSDHFLKLRWLDWRGCPVIFDVRSLNLNLQELVILDLSGSQVDGDWSGWELLKQARKLKVLKLTGCVQLTATPKFPASMELERLVLEGCSNLTVIDPSFCNLEKLVSLNMKECSLLCKLPDLGPMRNLKELVIDGTSISRINFQEGSMRELNTLSGRDCKYLNEISDSIRHLESLTYLALDGSVIFTLPESIKALKQLKTLSLKNCKKLTYLPDGIGLLRSLQFLDLSDTAIHMLPTLVEHLKPMKVLRMRGTLIQEFPEAILNLEKLEEIDFSLCGSLKGEIPFNIWRLSSLAILKLSDTQISGLPARFSPYRLRELHIGRCHNIKRLPVELPSSLNIRDDN